MKKIPAAKPFFSSSMPRSFIIEEMPGSSESETLVRSMYEIVYMMSATGMMRSQRSSFISGGIRAFVAKAQLRCRYNCAADQLLRHRPLHDRFNQFRGALVATVEIFAGGVRDAVRAPGFALRRDEHFTHGSVALLLCEGRREHAPVCSSFDVVGVAAHVCHEHR